MSKTKLWAVAKLLVIVLVSVIGSHATPIRAEGDIEEAPVSKEQGSEHDLKEILWFARAVYSESKLAEDQRLVACTIRNRVISGRWGDEYQGVVLARHQFSGLYPYSWNTLYAHNMSRSYESTGAAWKNALDISKKVYFAKNTKSICPELTATTMHFYSPGAVAQTPAWAHEEKLVYSAGSRFVFYANVN